MIFSQQMTRRLLALDETSWRALRAEVRWKYNRWALDEVPGLLKNYLPQLPADAEVWREYAVEITRLRRLDKQGKARAIQKQRELKARTYKRDYQRQYMREYRKGLTRRGA